MLKTKAKWYINLARGNRAITFCEFILDKL